MTIKSLFISFILIFGFLWGFSSYHFKFFPYNIIKKIVKHEPKDTTNYAAITEKNKIWAKKIIKGGYILHIRHAMREKWGDVTAFDAIELINNLDARNTSFYRAVCLTEKGIEEAKLINKIFEKLKIKVSYVVSSPSCRARETAIFAFKRIDQIEPSILHRTAQIDDQHIAMGKKLRSVIESIPILPNENIIISGHGGTLSIDYSNNVGIVDVNEVIDIDDRKETGIIVIEKKGDKFIARHKFYSIYHLINNILLLPTEDQSGDKFLFKDDIYIPENIKSGFIYHPNDTG